VSCASLLLELGLTRLFSVVLFYHFAFLSISVALLGLGAGGVFAYLRRAWLERFATAQLCGFLAKANSLLVLLVLEIVLHLPISLELTRWNFAKLTVMYLACAVPFFLTGLMFSVVFARVTERVGSLYAADLLGGAASCLAVVPLLDWVGGPNTILFAALLMAVAGAVWTVGTSHTRIRRVSLVLAAMFVLLIAANFKGKLIDIVYAKGARRDKPWVEWAKWNAISRVEVDQVGEAKYIVIDADASTAIMSADPKNWDKDIAPDNANLIQHPEQRQQAYNWKRDLMSAAPSLVNVLRPDGKYAIIGPGGGVDVLRAVATGSKDVTGIEINPLIANDVMRGRYADYSYHLYERPEVHMHVQDGRSFIRNSKEKYDVIQMTLVDTWASTAAGAFALSENSLYTTEAFQEYFDHLKPDGILAITRWEFKQPREALRVVSEEVALLNSRGEFPGGHFIVASDGTLDQDGRPVVVLFKRSAFTKEETAAIAGHLCANPNLKALYLPAEAPACASPAIQSSFTYYAPNASAFSILIDSVAPSKAAGTTLPNAEYALAQFEAKYPYNISPVTDDQPFFFFTFKTGDVIRKVLAGTGRGMDWRINLGVTVLFMVLGISIVAVLAFLIIPLAVHHVSASSVTSAQTSHGTMRLFYFIAVGLGYIMVEITLIQRFVLFLGHPTYALTVVIFLLLLSSGAGSFVARKWLEKTSRVLAPMAAILVLIVMYRIALAQVLSSLVGLPFTAKLLISGGLIIPLGFAMGMPYPAGLRALDTLGDKRVEWAWALNAAASVLGSVSAMIIAVHFGLSVTLLCGGAAYLISAALVASFRPAVPA